jgi:tetratricopeptide (TPR) repeat protein
MLLVLNISPLDGTVSDRWFYFPMVGLLGGVGVVWGSLGFSKKTKTVLLALFLIILTLFSVRTIIRNNDWHDEITFYQHDLPALKSMGSQSVTTRENDLAWDLMEEGRLDEAESTIIDSFNYNPSGSNFNTLGVIYSQKKDYSSAETWFKKAIATDNSVKAYENLSAQYILAKDYAKAGPIASQGLQHYPDDYLLWLRLGASQFAMGDKEGAWVSAQKAYGLNPNQITSTVLNELQTGQGKIDW